jgi:hypothetical protein
LIACHGGSLNSGNGTPHPLYFQIDRLLKRLGLKLP